MAKKKSASKRLDAIEEELKEISRQAAIKELREETKSYAVVFQQGDEGAIVAETDIPLFPILDGYAVISLWQLYVYLDEYDNRYSLGYKHLGTANKEEIKKLYKLIK